MDNKKNIVKDALLEVQHIMDAVEKMSKENTKSILESTIKKSYDEVVKESLNKNETETTTTDKSKSIVSEMEDYEDMDYDMEGDMATNMDDYEGGEMVDDIEVDDVSVDDDLGDSDLDVIDVEDDYTVNGTDKSTDELIDFLQTQGDVSVEVTDDAGNTMYSVQLGENTKLSEMNKQTTEDETIYELTLDESETIAECGEMDNMDEMETMDEEQVNEEEAINESETIYEIVLDDNSAIEEQFKHKAVKPQFDSDSKRTKRGTKKNRTSAFRVKPVPSKITSDKPKTAKARGEDENVVKDSRMTQIFSDKPKTSKLVQRESIKQKVEQIVTENEALKAKIAKYEEKLPQFKTKIEEMGVFSYKLAKVTKLFTENAVSRNEKEAILEAFDNITSTEECDKLYKSYQKQFATGAKSLKESIGKKSVIASSKSDKETINESTKKPVTSNPAFDRMKDLMKYTHKK